MISPLPLTRAPRLRAGDEARVVSMSASFPPASWKTALWFGEALGLKVTFGRSLSEDPGYLGRDPRRRADDFNAAVKDNAVRAIFLFRGGNAAAEVLPSLDYALLRRRPKVIAGYSDHASVVSATHAQTGLVTFLVPPMLQAPLRGRQRNLSVESFRAQAMAGPPLAGLWGPQAQVWRAGRARGRLVAGNLAVLRNLLGTPYLPALEGAVLAWEEISEPIQDINMILTQLENSGALAKVKGMVVGHLEGVPRRESGFTVRDIVQRHYAGPVLKTGAFGHFRPCYSLPLGVRVELDTGKAFRILEPTVE